MLMRHVCLQTAGPVALAEAIGDYSSQYNTTVTVLPPGTIYPYNWLLVSWRLLVENARPMTDPLCLQCGCKLPNTEYCLRCKNPLVRLRHLSILSHRSAFYSSDRNCRRPATLCCLLAFLCKDGVCSRVALILLRSLTYTLPMV